MGYFVKEVGDGAHKLCGGVDILGWFRAISLMTAFSTVLRNPQFSHRTLQAYSKATAKLLTNLSASSKPSTVWV